MTLRSRSTKNVAPISSEAPRYSAVTERDIERLDAARPVRPHLARLRFEIHDSRAKTDLCREFDPVIPLRHIDSRLLTSLCSFWPRRDEKLLNGYAGWRSFGFCLSASEQASTNTVASCSLALPGNTPNLEWTVLASQNKSQGPFFIGRSGVSNPRATVNCQTR